MAFVLRLTDAGRAAIADGANTGTRAVTFTKMALGAGQGPGGAGDDARTALRDSRNSVALEGSTTVAGRIAIRADFTPTETYDVTEAGLMGRIGADGTEELYAYWSSNGEDVTVSVAEIAVTIDPSITIGGLGDQPLWTLPLPQVATSDRALAVTPIRATAGGKVSVAAGTKLSLGERSRRARRASRGSSQPPTGRAPTSPPTANTIFAPRSSTARSRYTSRRAWRPTPRPRVCGARLTAAREEVSPPPRSMPDWRGS